MQKFFKDREDEEAIDEVSGYLRKYNRAVDEYRKELTTKEERDKSLSRLAMDVTDLNKTIKRTEK